MSNYPLSTCHFTVEWGGTRIGATEIIGLAVAMEPIKYREGSEVRTSPRIMPGKQKINSIVLRRGIVAGDNEYFNWLKTVRLNTVERRDLTIKLLNEQHEPVVVWQLQNAFPTRMEWTDLKAYANEPAIESIEVVYEAMRVINGD